MKNNKEKIRKFLKRKRWLKTLTWRVLSTATTFSVAYAVTGSFKAGGIIACVETVIKTIQYYFHERGWETFTRKKIKEIKSNQIEKIVSDTTKQKQVPVYESNNKKLKDHGQ